MIKILRDEIIAPDLWPTIPWEHQNNISWMYSELVLFRKTSGQSLIIRTPTRQNSGYRTVHMHEQLYMYLNAKRVQKKLPPLKVPTESCHLVGLAVDIYDPKKRVKRWILDNLEYSERRDLYYEEFDSTPDWVHMQLVPPASLKRFFGP